MASPHDVPEWLSTALEQIGPGTVAFPDDEEWSGVINRGDIRTARPMDGQSGARVVLVIEPGDGRSTWANVMMLTNLVEVATSKDVRLDADETSLSYKVLVETDIQGPIFAAQLGPRLGHVAAETLAQLEVVASGEDLDTLVNRRGLPVRSRSENRARWKDQELRAMHDLAAECFTELIGNVEEPAPLLVDPSLFETGADESEVMSALLRLVDMSMKEHLQLPAEALRTAEGALPAWIESLSPDQWTAFEGLWREALREEEVPNPQPEASTWIPARSTQKSELLERYVSARVDRGQRNIRLATRANCWMVPSSSDLEKGILKLKLSSKGLVQISPELLEVAA